MVVLATPKTRDDVTRTCKTLEWIHGEKGITYGLDEPMIILSYTVVPVSKKNNNIITPAPPTTNPGYAISLFFATSDMPPNAPPTRVFNQYSVTYLIITVH